MKLMFIMCGIFTILIGDTPADNNNLNSLDKVFKQVVLNSHCYEVYYNLKSIFQGLK